MKIKKGNSTIKTYTIITIIITSKDKMILNLNSRNTIEQSNNKINLLTWKKLMRIKYKKKFLNNKNSNNKNPSKKYNKNPKNLHLYPHNY